VERWRDGSVFRNVSAGTDNAARNVAPDVLRPQVKWRDLLALTRWERLWELTLSLPWLGGSIIAYALASAALSRTAGDHPGRFVFWLIVGGALSFVFFLTGLRQSHNAQHYCLGIGRLGHDIMLVAISLVMLASMHAVRVTHLHHHRHCLREADEEAVHASWPLWKVLVSGPYLIVRLHLAAWRLGKARDRAFIAVELAAIAAVVALVLLVLPIPALKWHVAAMLFGECLTAFFAVWIVHRGCEADGQIARTQRGWTKNLVTYSMFFHLEHHLWPAVPTCHLPHLAARLDGIAPQVCERQVI
jgi:fatty acid desaturase